MQSVPQLFGHPVPADSLPVFLDSLGNGQGLGSDMRIPSALQALLQSIACRGAVMFGQAISEMTRCRLVAQLSKTDLPFHCAHGRPTTSVLLDVEKAAGVGLPTCHRLQGLQSCSRGGRSSKQPATLRECCYKLGMFMDAM